MWETWVQAVGWKDSLEEGMATNSGILGWRIPMDREGFSPWGNKEQDMTERLSTAQHSPAQGKHENPTESQMMEVKESNI